MASSHDVCGGSLSVRASIHCSVAGTQRWWSWSNRWHSVQCDYTRLPVIRIPQLILLLLNQASP